LTPGHATFDDVVYRTFDPIGTALRCFRCHSTGPINLGENYTVTPSEPGVHCEACHGPGAAHVRAKGTPTTIQNPKRLTSAELNELCGACHRKASELDDETDWRNPWNVRHQPEYLHRAACFRNSRGRFSCVTCHDPHQPLQTSTAFYNSRCSSCHLSVVHQTPTASRGCIDCHMPQATASRELRFTNHWIGIYKDGDSLVPARRAVVRLQPAPLGATKRRFIVPSDPLTLSPVYAKALAKREANMSSEHPLVARASSDLGLFFAESGDPAAAEAPLRKALAIDRSKAEAMVPFDLESLASVLERLGERDDAIALLREAAAGHDAKVAARAYASLARLDPAGAEGYYTKAVEAEERASGPENRRVAALLHELALAMRERGDDRSAESPLRRALAIQRAIPKPDHHLTVGILNTLGNLLEGAQRFDDAEHLEREALRLSEERFGPESQELAITCANLADILWNKRELAAAAALYRRAIVVDESLYGAERPETAADVANLGMVLKEGGEQAAGDALLRRALGIYEKTTGSASAQAEFIRRQLEGKP
jgi:Tfp pilus assembly protein PilF